MTDRIYTIITGDQRYFWPECLKDNFVSLSFDKPYFEAWYAGDREAHLAVSMKHAKASKNGKTDQAIQSESTTWFNYANKLKDSEYDIFITRVENDLFWATSTTGDVFFRPHKDPSDGREVVAICKPVTKWSQFDQQHRKLTWMTLHKRARVFVAAQTALFQVVDEEMREYLHALLKGDDLSQWHSLPAWRARQGESDHCYQAFSKTIKQQSVHDMMFNMIKTVNFANGQLIEVPVKQKDLNGCSIEEMETHLLELFDLQLGRCALTNIVMHLSGQEGMNLDLKTSADRKDSKGHYEIGNMQIVCRFVNMWKSAMPDQKFRDLLKLVIETNSELTTENAV